MSQFDDAFAALLDAQEAAFGVRKKATIGGTDYDATIGPLDYENIIVAGGVGENGGFEVQVSKVDLVSKPAQFTEIVVAGRTLYVLRVTDEGSIWRILSGDPAVE